MEIDFLQDILALFLDFKDGILYFFPGVGRPDRVFNFLVGHLLITSVTMILSIIIGVFFGILITRVRKLYEPVIKLAGMLYTIPSLAFFGILIPIVGIGFEPAVIALTCYSLLAIIRNTAVGLDEVSPAILEAARGMGMTKWQALFQVELPIALPVILAGIRISTVSTISLATIASFFGSDSLGGLIFEGIAASGLRNDKVFAGMIGTVLLALLFDWAINKAEQVFEWTQESEEVADVV